jgi:hypothetical protein
VQFSSRFLLTLFQIAAEEGLIDALKTNLRAFLPTAGQPADDDRACETAGT